MDYREITAVVSDHVAVLTLNRPQRLNAYTPDMGQELMTAMCEMLSDERVRALILTGSGRGFCAGADREFLDGKCGRNGYALGDEPFITEFAAELGDTTKPLIAAVNGPAVGIGATMLLAFDMRLGSNTASFGFPFAKLGIVPGLGSSYFLPRLVGDACARELILTGATVEAARALQIGLLNEVVDAERLLPRAREIALGMAQHDPQVIESCKRVLTRGANSTLRDAMACERQEVDRLRRMRSTPAYARKPHD